MQLHEFAPGWHPIMPAKRKSLFSTPVKVEPGPSPHAGIAAVRANDPARPHQPLPHQHPVTMESGYDGAPQESHARALRVLDHDAVKLSSPHSKCEIPGKPRF